MKQFDFKAYTDKFLLLKYFGLICAMWLVVLLQDYFGIKIPLLLFFAVVFTILPLLAIHQRISLCYKGKFKQIVINENNILFKFWQTNETKTFKMSKIQKVYFNEIRRGKKFFDPYHFFLVFEFSKKNIFESIEIPSSRIFEFLDDFNSFIGSNNLNIEITNIDKIETLLNP